MYPQEDQSAYAPQGYYQQYPNLVPLPRPGGPVDLGLLQGGRPGGFAGTQGGYQPPTEERMRQLIEGLKQQFPRMGVAKPPGHARLAAVQAAQMEARKRMQKYQHQRRYSGRRP